MLADPENSPVFRTPSCGAQSRADHNRTDLPKAEQPSLVEVLQDLSLSDREELFFMQLPDCMPGRQKVDPAFESSADGPARKEAKSGDKRPAHLQTLVS